MKTLPVLRDACCTPLAKAPLSAEDAALLASRLKALADPARLRLLSLILASGDTGGCVCDLTEPVGLAQPTVSHHLKVLHDAGLVTREQRGVWAYYRADRATLADLAGALAL
ncbi:MAG TPA: metalloregulator ArsR/SmtB family transcription factor [Frankiaceae bacterium]|nr:metalloregulator ArsR/SmtB family transcription factor [Frankiaceae bacterium]